jgi:hypothetical protein
METTTMNYTELPVQNAYPPIPLSLVQEEGDPGGGSAGGGKRPVKKTAKKAAKKPSKKK